MGALQILEKIHNSGDVPGNFWFLSTLILTSILIIFLGIVIRYLYQYFKDDKDYKSQTNQILSQVREMVNLMREEQKYHRRDIDKNTGDIEELKKRKR